MKIFGLRTLLLIALAILVIGGGVTTFVFPQWEKAQTEKVRALIMQIPGASVGNVEMGLFDKVLTLHDLKIVYKNEEMTIEHTTKRATFTGVNIQAFSDDKTARIADAVSLSDVGCKIFAGENELVLTQQLNSVQITAPSFNPLALQRAAQPGAPLSTLSAVGFTLERINIAGMHLELFDQQSKEPAHVATLDLVTAEQVGLLSTGPVKWQGINVFEGKKKIISVEQVSLKELVVPDSLGVDLSLPPEELEKVMQAVYAKTPLRLTDLHAVNAQFFSAAPTNPMTLAKASLSLTTDATNTTVTSSIDSFRFPGSSVSGAEGALLNKLHPNEFVFSSQFQARVDQENGLATISIAPFQIAEPSLGEFTFSSAFSVPKDALAAPILLYMPGSYSLKALEVMLKDTGGLQLMAAAVAAEKQGADATAEATPKQALAEMAAQVRASQASSPAGLHPLINEFANFIEQGGSFTLKIQPAESTNLEELFMHLATTPQNVNITATHTK